VKVFRDRYVTENDQDIVVFLIGMRINKRLAVRKWFPVFKAMPAMIRELYENKEELGFLSSESFLGLRTTVLISYWKSSEDLLDYARGKKHLAAWKEFNSKIGNNEAVGIYHETYVIEKGKYEAFYRNMPQYGLAKATGHKPITAELNTVKKRLHGVSEHK
jgi:heme-degrading monooxygenase HmoA